MHDLQSLFDREQEAFGATEEEMEMKIAEILQQLEGASKSSAEAGTGAGDADGSHIGGVGAQYLDVNKIMDLNRECRKRIAQIGEIKSKLIVDIMVVFIDGKCSHFMFLVMRREDE